MKKFIFILSILFLSSTSFAKVNWNYTAFPYVPKGSPLKLSEPAVLRIGSEILQPVMSQQSGTHRYWHVEQLYLSKDVKKKLFVKYKVALSSEEPIGAWIRLRNKYVLHLRQGKDIVAYMAQGLNNKEMYEIQKQLSQATKKVAGQVWNPFISCAFAEVTGNPAGDGWGFSEDQWTPSEPAPTTESSMLARAAGIAKCVGGETLNKAWEGAKSGASSVKNAVMHPLQTMENIGAAMPSKEDLKQGASAVWEGTLSALGNVVMNPKQAVEDIWDGIGNAYDATTQLIIGVSQKAKEIVKGFSNLTAEVADYLVCQITSYLIQEGSMNAAMAVITGGGGLGVALAKLTAGVVRFAEKLKPMMPAFIKLSQASLSSEKRLEEAAKIMKGETSVASAVAKGEERVQEAAVAAARAPTSSGMSAAELKAAQKANKGLNDVDRIKGIESVVGREVTDDERKRLLEIHNTLCAGADCTAREIRDGKKLAEVKKMFPQASPQQIKDLYRLGYLGKDEGWTTVRLYETPRTSIDSNVVYVKPSKIDVNKTMEPFHGFSAAGERAVKEKNKIAAEKSYAEARSPTLDVAYNTALDKPNIALAHYQRGLSLPTPLKQQWEIQKYVDVARQLHVYDMDSNQFGELFDRASNGSLFSISSLGNPDVYRQVYSKYNHLTIMESMASRGFLNSDVSVAEIRQARDTYKALLSQYEKSLFP